MITDEMVKRAEEMVKNNSQIMGIFFKLSPQDQYFFKDKMQTVVTKSQELINKTLSENDTRINQL